MPFFSLLPNADSVPIVYLRSTRVDAVTDQKYCDDPVCPKKSSARCGTLKRERLS